MNAETRATYEDEQEYLRYHDNNRLVHREVAYTEIYLKLKRIFPLPFGEYDIHHVDRNRKNNNVDNLQILSREDHERVHGLRPLSSEQRKHIEEQFIKQQNAIEEKEKIEEEKIRKLEKESNERIQEKINEMNEKKREIENKIKRLEEKESLNPTEYKKLRKQINELREKKRIEEKRIKEIEKESKARIQKRLNELNIREKEIEKRINKSEEKDKNLENKLKKIRDEKSEVEEKLKEAEEKTEKAEHLLKSNIRIIITIAIISLIVLGFWIYEINKKDKKVDETIKKTFDGYIPLYEQCMKACEGKCKTMNPNYDEVNAFYDQKCTCVCRTGKEIVNTFVDLT